MGVPFTFAHGSIRLSLSRYTTEDQIETVLRVMPPVIARLREISPFAAQVRQLEKSGEGSCEGCGNVRICGQ